MEKQKVTVLGAGAFGTALGDVLKENGHEVVFYDPVLEILLEDALKGAQVQVLAAPSVALWGLVPKMPKEVPLIVATKGLMNDDMFADFAVSEIMSGPGFARDLKEHRDTKLTVTGKMAPALFERPYLKFDSTDDRRGVLLCGSLKNVYAILAGRLELEPGLQEYADFLTEAADEMRAILRVNGAKPETVDLSCGVGDLALTCSPTSRNFHFGGRLARDPLAQPEETVEGVSALKRIERGEIEVPPEAFRLRYLLNESKKWEEQSA